MLSTILIILFLLVILFTLGSGLVYLVKDKSSSTRTLTALKWRVGLSIVLFLMIILGLKTGYIQSNKNPLMLEPAPSAQESSTGQRGRDDSIQMTKNAPTGRFSVPARTARSDDVHKDKQS